MMPYFAVVEDNATFDANVHQRKDLRPTRVTLDHAETEQAIVRLDVANDGTLSGLDGRRVFMSQDGRLLLDGVLQPAPRGLIGNSLTLEIVATTLEPEDLDTQIAVLANSLKVAPYWDSLFIPPGKENDFVELLAARPAVVAHSRIAGQPFICDAFEGATTMVIRPERGSVEYTVDSTASKEYGIKLTAKWKQMAQQVLSEDAVFAGFTSATPKGLVAYFPKEGATIADGFVVQSSRCAIKKRFGEDKIVDTVRLSAQAGDDELDPEWKLAIYDFNVYEMDVALDVVYSYDVERSETAVLRFLAPTQSGIAQNAEEIEEIELRDMTEATAQKAYRPGRDYPIDEEMVWTKNVYRARVAHIAGDVPTPANWILVGESEYTAARRLPTFFRTTRGQAALEHALLRAQNRALLAARCVRVTFETSMPRPWLVTHDMSVRFTSSRLPGGAAEGRLVSYTLTWDAANVRSFSGTIACLAGENVGGTVSTLAVGTPSGPTNQSMGIMRLEVENDGEAQAELLRSLQNPETDPPTMPTLSAVEVPETVIRISVEPAAATSFDTELIVPISGSLAIARQVQV